MGWRSFALLRKTRRASKGGNPVPIQVPRLPISVKVRPGTTDAIEFEQVLVRRIYGCYRPTLPVKFVIDAGANVGYASAFFLEEYPGCKVTALEPEKENFELARMNLAPYSDRVSLMPLGLWPRPARLRVNPSERSDAFTVDETKPGEPFDCEGIDPLTLLSLAGQSTIDIFKCDIEGAEEFLFRENPDVWLNHTRALLIEIHNPRCEKEVYSAMRRLPFESFRYRELHVFIRKNRG